MIEDDRNVVENQILNLVEKEKGLTDEEIAEKSLLPYEIVFVACTQLAHKGVLERISDKGKTIKNYIRNIT